MPTYAFYATLSFFFVLCFLFALLILVQKGRGGGISAAFGGAGGNTAFGSKTGDVLTWATSIVFAIFLVMCVMLNLLANRVNAAATGKIPVAPAGQSSQANLPAAGSADIVAPAATQPTPAAADERPTTQPGAVVNPTDLGTR